MQTDYKIDQKWFFGEGERIVCDGIYIRHEHYGWARSARSVAITTILGTCLNFVFPSPERAKKKCKAFFVQSIHLANARCLFRSHSIELISSERWSDCVWCNAIWNHRSFSHWLIVENRVNMSDTKIVNYSWGSLYNTHFGIHSICHVPYTGTQHGIWWTYVSLHINVHLELVSGEFVMFAIISTTSIIELMLKRKHVVSKICCTWSHILTRVRICITRYTLGIISLVSVLIRTTISNWIWRT